MTPGVAVADMPQVLLVSSFAATQLAVREQVAKVSVLLENTAIDPDRFNDMLIVLGEVLNNIVEHSCADLSDTNIQLTIQRSENLLTVQTEDLGKPLPPTLLGGRDRPSTDVSIDDLPEGGFGWFLIHSLIDNMEYERYKGINKLRFIFNFD